MLSYLHVKNIALIDELELEFNEGLNVITGETGAGKSILVGSINAVLGSKISKDFIRAGAESASIELVFVHYNPLVDVLLESMDIESEEQLIISRKLGDRSVFRINGQIVNGKLVTMIADILLDIHSQHEHQSLLDQKNHILLLDRFLSEELSDLQKQHKGLYQNYLSIKRQLDEKELDENDRLREIDFLEYEISEIEKANIQIEADSDLEERYRLAMKSGEIIQGLNKAYEYLKGSDYEQGAASLAEHAMKELLIYNRNTTIQSFLDQLDSIILQVESLSGDMVGYVEDLDLDPNELVVMKNRLDELNRIRMKHGTTLEDVLSVLEIKKERLSHYLDQKHYRRELLIKKEQLESQMALLCDEMTKVRTQGAKKIEILIENQLKGLNLSDSQFVIQVSEKDQIGIDGKDLVAFMITTNPGQPLKPLAQVASGGEVSRIMLAIKSVLSTVDTIDTMIFDEIDVGISGMTAQLVGEKLYDVGKARQIITITHLPQIAAMADYHYLIKKVTASEEARIEVQNLDDEEMVLETARLLSGKAITEAVILNARELKNYANQYKKKKLN